MSMEFIEAGSIISARKEIPDLVDFSDELGYGKFSASTQSAHFQHLRGY